MLSVNQDNLDARSPADAAWIGPAPWIETPPPGPVAKTYLERDRATSAPSYLRSYPLVVDRARGSVVQDVDGNRFLDFAAGVSVCIAGHSHPRIVSAVQEQVAKLVHIGCDDFYTPAAVDLMERLASIGPGRGAKRVLLTVSGAEAVEAAFKLARYHTGRQWVVGFRGANHGRSMGALSLTCSDARSNLGFEPLVPMVAHVPYGDTEALEADLFRYKMAPTDVAAIFVEPIQATGPYTIPEASFFSRLRTICDRHGILLVVDETHTGMGRSGKWFAIQHFGVVPDVSLIASGLGSGMPLGAVIAKQEVSHWPTGPLTSTSSGNPVSCAAALATLDIVEGGAMANAGRLGGQLRQRLDEIAAKRRCLVDVRGLGLTAAVDVASKKTGKLDHRLRDRVLAECFQRGLILLPCGSHGIRFCPPLVINGTQLDVGLQLFDEAVATVV